MRAFDLLAIPLVDRHWWRWENENSTAFTVDPLAYLIYDGNLQQAIESVIGLEALRRMCAFVFWSLGNSHQICQKSCVCPLCGTQLYSRTAVWCKMHLNFCANQFRAFWGHPSKIPLVVDLLCIFHIRGQSLPTSLVNWCGSFPFSTSAPCIATPGSPSRKKPVSRFPPPKLHTIDEQAGSKRGFDEDENEECSPDPELDLSGDEQFNRSKRRKRPPGPGRNVAEPRPNSQ